MNDAVKKREADREKWPFEKENWKPSDKFV